MKRALLFLAVAIVGCRAQRPKPEPLKPLPSATTQPILYHRTGGIAGTDDRVIIWPDGIVQVSGEILPPGEARLETAKHEQLRRAFDGWQRLSDEYLMSNAMDAYTITISYGDKTIVASDLAPNLPEQFRKVFTEIEAIAAQATQAQPSP